MGGNFFDNNASGMGGVIMADEGSSTTVSGGVFHANKAENGGVVYVNEDAALLFQNGSISENVVGNGGGAFFVHEDGQIEVSQRQARGRRGGAFHARLLTTWAMRWTKHAWSLLLERVQVENHSDSVCSTMVH